MKGEILENKPKVPDFQKPKMLKEDPQDVEMKDNESSEKSKDAEKKDVDLLTLEGPNCYNNLDLRI